MEKFSYTLLVTLVSGFVSSYVTVRLGLHKDLVAIRRERFERLATLLINVDETLQKYRYKYLFDDDKVQLDDVQFSQIAMLTKLYFVKVEKEFSSFNLAVTNYKQNLFASKKQLINSQQSSKFPNIKAIPTQQMIDDNTNLTIKVFAERDILLEALITNYPLLKEKSFMDRLVG